MLGFLKLNLRLLPESWEIAMGNVAYRGMIASQGGRYRGSKNYQADLEKVGRRLVQFSLRSHLPFEFTAIDSNLVNAWCMPGGKIACYRGLFREMENDHNTYRVGKFSFKEKIAAVMSHEISHATKRHTARGLEMAILLSIAMKTVQVALSVFILQSRSEQRADPSQSVQRRNLTDLASLVHTLFNGSYNLIYTLCTSHGSRAYELEADEEGIYNMMRAGYNPKAAIWLQKFFESQNGGKDRGIRRLFRLISSHPDSNERALLNAKTIEKTNAKRK